MLNTNINGLENAALCKNMVPIFEYAKENITETIAIEQSISEYRWIYLELYTKYMNAVADYKIYPVERFKTNTYRLAIGAYGPKIDTSVTGSILYVTDTSISIHTRTADALLKGFLIK